MEGLVGSARVSSGCRGGVFDSTWRLGWGFSTAWGMCGVVGARVGYSAPVEGLGGGFVASGGKVLLVVVVVCLAWADKALRPPTPKPCGSPGGPPVTTPRIRLRDGRYLAYKLYGVPKDEAKHKFIFIHGFDSCRLHAFIATEVSPDTIQSLGLHVVGFDRPGYGDSDPDPNRTPKSLALDVEELADQLGLGPKFYVVGYSMGGEAVWGLLKYIPH
ncbi:Protein ABHD11, partial [Bienertia sinuspersici]